MSAPTTPREDFAEYLQSYPREMAMSDEDPAAVLDRYYADDFEQWNDGMRFDRDLLIAHARPARKNAVSVEVDVHDVLVVGSRVAARYTMQADMRSGRSLAIDVYLFGQLADDGRLRRIDQITRTVTETS